MNTFKNGHFSVSFSFILVFSKQLKLPDLRPLMAQPSVCTSPRLKFRKKQSFELNILFLERHNLWKKRLQKVVSDLNGQKRPERVARSK